MVVIQEIMTAIDDVPMCSEYEAPLMHSCLKIPIVFIMNPPRARSRSISMMTKLTESELAPKQALQALAITVSQCEDLFSNKPKYQT